MRARSRWVLAGLLGAASLGSAPAAADSPPNAGVRIDQLQPASPESAFFRAEGPHNPAAEGVEFAAGLNFEYAKGVLKYNLLDVTGGKKTTTLVDNLVLARVAGSITPLHWLAFDLSFPFALFESGHTPPPVGKDIPAGKGPGVGDPRIGVHFRPVDTQAFNLILGGRVWAPIGSQKAYLTDGTVRAEVDIGAAGDVGRVLYGCTFNIGPGFFAKRAGDRFGASCAAHVKLGEIVSLGVEPTFALVNVPRVQLTTTAPGSALNVLFEPLAEARFRFGGFRLGVAAGPGLGGGAGNAEVRALINAAYVGLGKPPKPVPQGPPDRDLDKIPDAVDACPDEAGPPSKDPKANGCPSRDRDGDGIRDDEDACPDRAGIPYADPKGNGCPDSDNDGLPDPVDRCVNEPGPAASSGCPKFAHLVPGGFKIEPPLDFGPLERLSRDNRAALEELAATLRANPKLDRATFTLGTKGVKPAVTEKRTQEILGVLRAGSLDPSRYELVLREDVRGGLLQVKIGK